MTAVSEQPTSPAVQVLADQLAEFFGDKLASCSINANEATIEVNREDLLDVAQSLFSEPQFSFKQLVDLCGVDYSAYGDVEWATSAASGTGFSRGVDSNESAVKQWQGERFAAVYHLLSHRHNRRLRIRVFADETTPVIDSVINIWSSADWFEREAFDLFGIMFSGHPDLRRILTDYGFIGHPFRKDFPLIGHVEMRYDAEKKRVVYQPVSIEERVLVPRVIREDSRYTDGLVVKQPEEDEPPQAAEKE
ncbi:MAG: NADH-quinone oxidoreductase subunit C [Gammaproteobacteria bacterium]|nr:MAG: NADH-quinone oxidoreductase subunit C [Gammaproteobacteria bacterium]